MSGFVTDKLLTLQEVADLTNFSTDTVAKWITKGELRSLNFAPGGGKPSYRVRPSDLTEFLETRTDR